MDTQITFSAIQFLIGLVVVTGSVVATIHSMFRKVDEKLSDGAVKLERLSTSLWGATGNNGLQSAVRRIETTVDEIQADVTRLKVLADL